MKILICICLFLVAENASASCSDVTGGLFGLTLGPVVGYPENLAKGIKREGTAELVEGVGFESLEGKSQGIRFDRIMVYFDRGNFIAYDAIASIPMERDQGLKKILAVIERLGGSPLKSVGATEVISCEGGAELSVSRTTWDGGTKRIRISVKSELAQTRMHDYVAAYCADKTRVRPQDACKR